jgi:hypothetical protein
MYLILFDSIRLKIRSRRGSQVQLLLLALFPRMNIIVKTGRGSHSTLVPAL